MEAESKNRSDLIAAMAQAREVRQMLWDALVPGLAEDKRTRIRGAFQAVCEEISSLTLELAATVQSPDRF